MLGDFERIVRLDLVDIQLLVAHRNTMQHAGGAHFAQLALIAGYERYGMGRGCAGRTALTRHSPIAEISINMREEIAARRIGAHQALINVWRNLKILVDSVLF